MKKQNFSNHSRLVPGYHFVLFIALFALIVGSIVNLVNCKHETLYAASLIVLISVILILFFIYTRTFALKAQDRAIRAEENLRHYVLTGKLLNPSLNIHQVIALRFASDEEFLALIDKTIAEKLSPKAIKQSIKNWRADNHRA